MDEPQWGATLDEPQWGATHSPELREKRRQASPPSLKPWGGDGPDPWAEDLQPERSRNTRHVTFGENSYAPAPSNGRERTRNFKYAAAKSATWPELSDRGGKQEKASPKAISKRGTLLQM